MRQMEESNMTRIEPMELEIVSHFHPEAGYYPEEDTTSPQMTKEEWLEKISKLKKGALPFIKLFEKHEEEYMNNGSVRFHIWEDGTGYLEKLGDFSEIHLFKKTKGLGMVIPEDIGFETIGKYLSE
uniref:JmjC domain-containing protein n=1 Tax=Caenorhabditis tropicalis TaxID=1561998 RepID=A0A1I7U8U5_9PELO